MSVVAFDLDGVLAEPPPKPGKPWRLMGGYEREERNRQLLWHYGTAVKLFDPGVPFHVVTARGEAARETTDSWLKTHFGDEVIAVHYLVRGRTYENVIQFKAAVLNQIGATAFYEDSLDVVRGVVELVPEKVAVYLFRRGRIVRRIQRKDRALRPGRPAGLPAHPRRPGP